MNKADLLGKLKSLHIKCILIDDSSLSPIEIIVITNSTKFLKPDVITDDTRSRMLTVLNNRFFYHNQYGKQILKALFHQDSDIITPSRQDCINLLKLYAYRHGNENDLYKHLESLSITTCSTNVLKHSMRHNLYRFFAYLLPAKRLHTRKKHYFSATKNAYIETLQREKIVSSNYTLLSEAGASASVYMKDGNTFLKGNEYPEYHGIPNEITIRDYLIKKKAACPMFVEAISYDRELGYLKYPYLNFQDLSSYLAHQKLTCEELNSLGTFLLNLLDFLFHYHINHNDLKPNNIMLQTDSSSNQMTFLLSDFGCASIDGSYPFSYNYFGRYLARRVCGKYRYHDTILDDVASAYQTYLDCGGHREDLIATQLFTRIGRQYLNCTTHKWSFIRSER